MRDDKAATSDEPRAASQEATAPETDAPPPSTPPPAAACGVMPAAETGAETPATRYAQYQVLTHCDTMGRTFQEFRSRDGSPDLFKGVAIVERRWLDGLGARQPFPFTIAAASVDEAYARYDDAKAAAEQKGGEEMDREHTRMVLSGAVPPPPQQRPVHLPAQGQGGRRRRN